MTTYLESLRTAPLADLEATATRAVRNAVAAAHAAGRSTVGLDASGRLVRTLPDGREVALGATQAPKKQAKVTPAVRVNYVDMTTAKVRRTQSLKGLVQRRMAARAAAALKIVNKGKELRRAVTGALSQGPAKPAPTRKRQKGLDR